MKATTICSRMWGSLALVVLATEQTLVSRSSAPAFVAALGQAAAP